MQDKTEYNKAYRLINKKRMSEQGRAYRKEHLEEIKAYDKLRYRKNREKRLVWQKQYCEKNRSKLYAQQKAYRLANAEKMKARKKADYLIHIKDNLARAKAYRKANPEKDKIHGRKRRALKLGVDHVDYTANYVFERDNWTCGICGRKINKRLKYPNPLSKSIDHIIPLSKGGNDNPVNVQASHLRCNIGKNAINKGQLRLFG